MSRIRSIKPEFPQSETIGKLSRDARLLFIQLWTLADDEGRARASSRMLASLLFPYDDDAPHLIEGWIAELEANGCVRRYDIEGSTYLEVCNWLKHQKIDHPSKSKIPPFRECSRGLAPDLGPRTLDLGPGSRKKERKTIPSESKKESLPSALPEPSAPAAIAKKSNRILKHSLPEGWQPDESDFAYRGKLGLSEGQFDDSIEAMRLWAKANDAKKVDWHATLKGFLRRDSEKTRPNIRAGPASNFNGNSEFQGYGGTRPITAFSRPSMRDNIRHFEESAAKHRANAERLRVEIEQERIEKDMSNGQVR